jgi:hypothetical protein
MSPTAAEPIQAAGAMSVRMSYPVSRSHSSINVFLINILGTFVEEKKLGEIHTEPFLMKTGQDLPARMPDILFVAAENRAVCRPTCSTGRRISMNRAAYASIG